MRRRSGDRSSFDDSGFTLVELMAALTVLTIGIVGTIGVMNSAIRVAGTTGARSKGVAVATKHIETLRAVPYDQLVVDSPTATVVPFDDKVGNRVYRVTRTVADEAEATPTQPSGGTPGTKAYKKGYVSVTWNDESGFHEVHQTTLIYPGGRGPSDVSKTVTSTGNSGIPDPPTALAGVPVATATAIDLTWLPPAVVVNTPRPVRYIVRYARDPTFPSTQVQEVAANIPESVTLLRVPDLAAGTTYHFRIYSQASDGTLSTSYSQALNITTVASTALSCTVGAASVTPSAVKKKNASLGGGLATSPIVMINTGGVCTDTTFRMEYSPSAGVNRDILLTPDLAGSYSGTIPGLTDWDVGDHAIDIYSYVLSVKTKRASLRLTVCAHNKQTCP